MQPGGCHRAGEREKNGGPIGDALAHELESGALLPADVRGKSSFDDLGGLFAAGDAPRFDVARPLKASPDRPSLALLRHGDAFLALVRGCWQPECVEQLAVDAAERAVRQER